jgi:hypothetical protein
VNWKPRRIRGFRYLAGFSRRNRTIVHTAQNGQEKSDIHADVIAARQALEAVTRVKWRRNYQDL